VVSENARVIEASHGVVARRFGELMNASHASLRDDFEVSIPPLDLLVQLLQECPGVFGARLTGAGFGGACIALAEEGGAEEIIKNVLPAYQKAGHVGKILVS
jgi:galactokinase